MLVSVPDATDGCNPPGRGPEFARGTLSGARDGRRRRAVERRARVVRRRGRPGARSSPSSRGFARRRGRRATSPPVPKDWRERGPPRPVVIPPVVIRRREMVILGIVDRAAIVRYPPARGDEPQTRGRARAPVHRRAPRPAADRRRDRPGGPPQRVPPPSGLPRRGRRVDRPLRHPQAARAGGAAPGL